MEQRLVINRIQLENFKSYAGVVEIGPFHGQFSAIVGPNGSGKSNVLDALLFAFGKRANKIRLSKVSELIHKSEGMRNLEFARVTVFFQDVVDSFGDDGSCTMEPVRDSAFSISRVAYRNNSSKYFINDDSSTFTEVTDLLKEKHVDLNNNRFLILQGEVEQIAMMKPKSTNAHDTGFLEYIEDIIGSNQYVDTINEAEVALEELNEDWQGKMNRFRAARQDMERLESGKAEAEELQRKLIETRSLRVALYRLDLGQYAKHLESISAETVSLHAEKDSLEQQTGEVSAKEKEIEIAYESLRHENATFESKIIALDQKFQEFDKKDIAIQESQKFTRAELKKLVAKVKKSEKGIADAQGTMQGNAVLAKDLESEKKALKSEISKLEKQKEKAFERVQQKTEPIKRKLEKQQNELIPYVDRQSACQRELDSITSQLGFYEEKLVQSSAQLQEIERKLKLLPSELGMKLRTLDDLKEKQASLGSRVESMQAKVEALCVREKQLQEELKEARTAAAEASTEQKAESTRGVLFQKLESASQRKELQGIVGRLGDIGQIGSQFDIAVSTACPQLDQIVVTTTAAARECVSFLKKKNLGTATFIILEKLQYLKANMGKAFKPPANAKRLFDLVQPHHPDYSLAFYFALRDTLVVQDLDQAKHCAFQGSKRHRVVTLQGDLIDPSGVMSGGGKRVAKGRLQLNGYSNSSRGAVMTPSQVQELHSRVACLAQDLKTVRKDKTSLAKSLASEKSAWSKNDMEGVKLEMECQALEEQVRLLKKRHTSLSAAQCISDGDLQSIKDLEHCKAAAEKEASKAKKASASIEAAIAKLEEELMEAGGASLRDASEKLKESEGQLQNVIKRMTQMAVGVEKAEKSLATHESALQSSLAQIEEKEAALEGMQKRQAAIVQQAERVLAEKDTIVAEGSETVEALKECREKYEQLKAHSSKLKTRLVEVTMRLEDAYKETQSLEAKVVDIRNKLGHSEKDLVSLYEELGEDPQEASMVGDISRDELKYKMIMLEEEMEGVSPNLGVLEQYRSKHADFTAKSAEIEQLNASRSTLRSKCDGLRKERLDCFMKGFTTITLKLKEMYRMLTLGGDAELELVDSLDPFSEGIVFSVRPPKKSWKNISNLSGGEKTLSSLALVFSLHYYKPTPLYVMDEIDAALDFKNVSIVANYIKERTKNAQFVIISLRNNMFELGNRLVGVYKTENQSKTITLDPSQFVHA